MILDLQGSEIVIDRLRLTGSATDSALVMRRLASMLHDAHLHPAGLSTAAIVFIRRLHDPLPGTLRLDRSGGHLPARWDQAAAGLLDRLVSGAARAALGAVSASAEAVIFLDRSELLACLASDWCEGNVMKRWWWESLLKQKAASQVVKELWQRTPEYVPAALQQLATWKQAVDFVRGLSDADAEELLRGVARSFALSSLLPVLTHRMALNDFAAPAEEKTAAPHLNQTLPKVTREETGKAKSPAPWRSWVPESDGAGLRPAQELFFGVALMLQRAPARVRAASFPASVRDWERELAFDPGANARVWNSNAVASRPIEPKHRIALREDPISSPDSQLVNDSRGADQIADDTALLLTDALQQTRAANASPRAFASESAIAVDKSDARESRPGSVHDKQGARPSVDRGAPPLTGKTAPATLVERRAIESLEFGVSSFESNSNPAELETRNSRLETSVTQVLQPAAMPVETASPARENLSAHRQAAAPTREANSKTDSDAEWIETQLGGLFYLINLGLFLGLYVDFTTPDERELELDIWDFVTLVGGELVGAHLKTDVVWSLLARLAQRKEDVPPGSDFEPGEESFEFQVLNSERQESFELEKRFEFQVSSFKLDEDPPSKQELATRNSELQTSTSKLQTWLARLLPYIRERLRLALGLSGSIDPGLFVCAHKARVCVTPTHLDVYFRLDELPIAIRVAALDRNPGWVPAAGRFIAFHFE